ncbi:MAG TPA: zinc ribbon domain-containing protein [Chloroflexota bacterium]|nr:zinc ribbon domain-containing protein [Chloroflexota bacterium]
MLSPESGPPPGDSAVASSGQAAPAGGGWRPRQTWECAQCGAFNPPTAAFCAHCGRLSHAIEEELRAREEFVVLDGLQALRGGDEASARRCFALATERDPRSQVAWYWRTRTGETVDDVIYCLEQMLRLDPSDSQTSADLELARLRKQHEAGVATARAATEAAQQQAPRGPGRVERAVTSVRYLALEVGSVPSFVIGLFWGRTVVLTALAIAGVRGGPALMPNFQLPAVMVSLPADMLKPLPSTLSASAAVVIVLAVWYVWLAFGLAEGTRSARYLAIGSGLAALLATRLIASNGQWFLDAALLLTVLAIVGKPRAAAEHRLT